MAISTTYKLLQVFKMFPAGAAPGAHAAGRRGRRGAALRGDIVTASAHFITIVTFFGQVRCPVRILQGAEDTVVPPFVLSEVVAWLESKDVLMTIVKVRHRQYLSHLVCKPAGGNVASPL